MGGGSCDPLVTQQSAKKVVHGPLSGFFPSLSQTIGTIGSAARRADSHPQCKVAQSSMGCAASTTAKKTAEAPAKPMGRLSTADRLSVIGLEGPSKEQIEEAQKKCR